MLPCENTKSGSVRGYQGVCKPYFKPFLPIFCGFLSFSSVSHIGIMSSESSEPHTSHSYDLISVIEHSGPFDNGHYTCVVREPRSGQFFFCNDSVVKPVDVSQFKAPYVLFYRRCQLSV